MTCTWSLIDVNLFSILCPHKYACYKENHTFHKYSKEDYIYFEKDNADKIYLIESGKVKIGYYTEDGREILGIVSMNSFSTTGEDREVCVFENAKRFSDVHGTIIYEIISNINPSFKRVVV